MFFHEYLLIILDESKVKKNIFLILVSSNLSGGKILFFMDSIELKYAIIDVETTGMGIRGNRITEIAVLVHDGNKVIDRFHSLVNPECTIPFAITRLTGIDNHMVSDAPKFFEIAKDIIEITTNCVFVAHNVNFDYNVIHKEFMDLGFPYKRKKLCTIRLSRK